MTLEPCPKCGGKGIAEKPYVTGFMTKVFVARIRCTQCNACLGASGLTSSDARETVENAWNRRQIMQLDSITPENAQALGKGLTKL